MGTVESLQRRRAAAEHPVDQASGQMPNGAHVGTHQALITTKGGKVPHCFGAPLMGGRYHLGPVLGAGSSATVFIGWDSVAQCKVALKVRQLEFVEFLSLIKPPNGGDVLTLHSGWSHVRSGSDGASVHSLHPPQRRAFARIPYWSAPEMLFGLIRCGTTEPTMQRETFYLS